MNSLQLCTSSSLPIFARIAEQLFGTWEAYFLNLLFDSCKDVYFSLIYLQRG